MPALLALISAAAFGAADFAGGFATRKTSVLNVTLVTNTVGVVLAAGLVAILGGTWTVETLAWGAAGGICGLIGLSLLFLGLASGPNRVISPLSAVLSAVLPVAVGLTTGDRPDSAAIVGLILTPLAIWLVAGGDSHIDAASRKSLGYGIGAGIGFGLFITCIAQAPEGSGALPLLAARTASSTLVILVVLLKGRPKEFPKSAITIAAIAGSIDMVANGLFLWSSREGDLAVVGALVALYPATTILLAIILLHERLNKAQAVGLVLAITAAVLLS